MKFSLDDLKSKGRKTLRKSKRTKEKAEKVRAEADALGKAGKDLVRESFRVEGLLKAHESRGDVEAAAAQRKMLDDRRDRAEQNFRLADAKGAEAAALQRKAYKLEYIARRIVEQVKEFEEEEAG